ncbi:MULTISPECIES: glycoside hydrolase family 15 protein [Bacillaceae]|uniref:Phosphorylase kinase alpha/beta subunit n=1 Tax=Peribacillus huizhouensis TaxID=1501239 RepID=A0ABR6CPX4_9BACI|nr:MULTISPECIES: glycoside hydrolase family 15 protein [Bacillaceae]MBA9027078.1 phosphorylase kinase alpha/beta subunit [Peribacillus huizhouensis]
MNTNEAIKVLDRMRLSNGAYTASLSQDYSFVWIRDIVYTVLPFMQKPSERYEKAYHALFDLFKTYEWKIDIHRQKRPVYLFEYIHSRYSTDLKEIPVEWGHAQNDAIGAFLWGVGEGYRLGQKVIRDEKDLEIVQKLVDYLDCLQYWQAKDNGMWEENMELHTSSIGACVAGLNAVKMLVNVKEESIKKGEETLRFLLPRESESKDTDLALLSLVYPYRILDRKTALKVVENVSTKLERKYGVIRYENDQYYNQGSEAEWCFGLPWLGLCYLELGLFNKAIGYLGKTEAIIPENWEVPELYIGGTNIPNGNTPLAWSVALSYLFIDRIGKVSDEKAT